MSVRYKSGGGAHPYYQCGAMRHRDGGAARCMTIRGDLVDRAVAERLLDVVRSGELGLALQAFDELRGRRRDVDHQWRLQVQRAEYDADLARADTSRSTRPTASSPPRWRSGGKGPWRTWRRRGSDTASPGRVARRR